MNLVQPNRYKFFSNDFAHIRYEIELYNILGVELVKIYTTMLAR